jgi:hypothetical protein
MLNDEQLLGDMLGVEPFDTTNTAEASDQWNHCHLCVRSTSKSAELSFVRTFRGGF